MKVLLINHFPLEGSGSGTYTKTSRCICVSVGTRSASSFRKTGRC